ncbi:MULTISPECIES: DUF6197 family protein [Streptomyces]|uniref:DUF6197 family protein n=1 Tax=Streptomyces TaxID=1883 RepID=UPI0004C8B650|nr:MULTISPECIES: hypothetical protein [Streptomyces]
MGGQAEGAAGQRARLTVRAASVRARHTPRAACAGRGRPASGRTGTRRGRHPAPETGRPSTSPTLDTHEPRDCPVCVVGALSVADGLHPEQDSEASRQAQAFLAARIDSVISHDPIERIADWSDAREAPEVITELRRIADETEAAGSPGDNPAAGDQTPDQAGGTSLVSGI